MRSLTPSRLVVAFAGLSFLSACADRAESPLGPNGPRGVRPPAGDIAEPIDDPHPVIGDCVPGQIVARVAGGDASALAELYGVTTLRTLGDDYVLVRVPESADDAELVEQMPGTAGCIDAQLNYFAQSPESEQGAVAFYEGDAIASDVIDQAALARIGLDRIDDEDGRGVVVAIVDTGIDATHPDLAGSVLPGWDFVDDDADATEEVGRLDQDRDGLLDEAAGHGTHVAGIVHAVAPRAELLPVRVLDPEGRGSATAVAEGIRWAVDQGADVINLSLGMSTESRVMRDAIRYAVFERGVFVATSAGNHGRHMVEHYPAKYDHVLAVAAVGLDDLRAPFTTYADFVEVSAPGVGILSTYLDHGYATWSGTSMAAPMAAGAAALYLSERSSGNPHELRERIEESARSFASSEGIYEEFMGDGILDLAALLD